MSNERYHYVECGLPNVWLSNGFELMETPYGQGVSIRDLQGLHRCIARVLCDKPKKLTGAEFRYLRRELDMSQKMTGQLLGITAKQVRNIERGVTPMKEPYNCLIRHMYLAKDDPNNTYAEVFERLRNLDLEWHETLQLTNSEDEDWFSNIRQVA